MTDESVSESSSLQAYVDGLFFNKDENNLQDMIDSIPPGMSVWATSHKNVSLGIFEQLRFKPACSATEAS